ncbi:hypothetical protein XH92_14540 [Bradyrhizobium sp. CCBAU 53421]|nr:hypothetical protein XH92_14540 [Bradyrhizobium sp. CCBAU 53421]
MLDDLDAVVFGHHGLRNGITSPSRRADHDLSQSASMSAKPGVHLLDDRLGGQKALGWKPPGF